MPGDIASAIPSKIATLISCSHTRSSNLGNAWGYCLCDSAAVFRKFVPNWNGPSGWRSLAGVVWGAAHPFLFVVPWAPCTTFFSNTRGGEGQDVRSGDFCEMHFL